MNEEPLVVAAAGGDHKAFVSLVRLHDDALRALAFSLTGNEIDMDDVLQTAYMKAFRSISSFKQNSSFKTWIYRIVHNVAIDDQRKRSKISYIGDASEFDGPADDDDRDAALDIDSALAQLTEAQRAVVLLVDGEGFDYATAAEIIGIPPGTVASRINQARSRLRTLLASDKDSER